MLRSIIYVHVYIIFDVRAFVNQNAHVYIKQ